MDEETGLYYYGARYYNPRESVWLSTDPLSGYNPVLEREHYIDGQHNGGVYNSFNLNTYIYCYQSPVKLVDPNGKQAYFQGMFNQSAMQAAAWNQQHPQKPMTSGVIKDALSGVKKDVGKIAGPIIRQMPERMENVGDRAAEAGYLLTLTGAGAEFGVSLFGVGNAVSLGGTGLGILIDLYDGKFTEVSTEFAKTLLIEGGQRLINKKIDKLPGASKATKDILTQTVDMTIKAVDKAAAEIFQSQNSTPPTDVNKKTPNNP